MHTTYDNLQMEMGIDSVNNRMNQVQGNIKEFWDSIELYMYEM